MKSAFSRLALCTTFCFGLACSTSSTTQGPDGEVAGSSSSDGSGSAVAHSGGKTHRSGTAAGRTTLGSSSGGNRNEGGNGGTSNAEAMGGSISNATGGTTSSTTLVGDGGTNGGSTTTTSKGGAASGGAAGGGTTGGPTGGTSSSTGTTSKGGTASGGTTAGGASMGGAAGGPKGGTTSSTGTQKPPTCADDGNAQSVEFIHPVYGCGHRFGAESSSDYWVVFDSGFHYDRKTGYGWHVLYQLSNHTEALSRCKAVTAGGLSGWQLPSIDHVRTVTAGCAPITVGGTCPLSSTCETFDCGHGAQCESCLGVHGPGLNGYYCRANARICPNGHTTGLCSDCAAHGYSPEYTEWVYVAGNGGFGVLPPSYVIQTFCVTPLVPNY
ncbi:MAG: hypothetical protein QM784_18755 [Polyangiaceae bacterium]